MSLGKQAWSPDSSTSSVGALTPGAARTKPAMLAEADQVDSHASAVT